jgi:hypothetical protein
MGDDIAGGLQMLWPSASGLWLGLACLNSQWMLPEVSAAIFSRWYLVASGLMTLRIPGMGLPSWGKVLFWVVLWIQHSHARTHSHSAGCRRVVGRESRRACCIRTTCHREAYTFSRKRGVERVKEGERALDWVVSASDRTKGTWVLDLG